MKFTFLNSSFSMITCLTINLYVSVHGSEVKTGKKSKLQTFQPVRYDCDFVNMWSSTNHPDNYPSSAHWSPPIIATHSSNYQMWAADALASAGIESVAETGSPSGLINEMKSEGDNVGNYRVGQVQFNSNKQRQTIRGLRLDAQHKYISSASMIAPSPDWFTGFHDISPVSDDGFWYNDFTVTTFPYDAGTEEGRNYSLSNASTNPKEGIFPLTAENFDKHRLTSIDDEGMPVVNPVARFECQRVQDELIGNFRRKGVKSNVPVHIPVKYDVKFINRWNSMNHPYDYPSDAHFSPPVIVAHSRSYNMWNLGQKATVGVQTVAETGNPEILLNEIGDAGTKTLSPITGTVGSSQNIRGLEVDKNHRFISAITMLAPSPDWFTGFHDISPIKKGTWLKSFDVVVFPHDGGTDSGETFTSSDEETEPVQDIFRLTPSSVPEDSPVFVGDDGFVRTVAIFRFNLDTSNIVCEDNTSFVGGNGQNCEWMTEFRWRIRNFCNKRSWKNACAKSCGTC